MLLLLILFNEWIMQLVPTIVGQIVITSHLVGFRDLPHLPRKDFLFHIYSLLLIASSPIIFQSILILSCIFLHHQLHIDYFFICTNTIYTILNTIIKSILISDLNNILVVSCSNAAVFCSTSIYTKLFSTSQWKYNSV